MAMGGSEADGVAIVDGQRMPLDQATVPVTDLGFLRGFCAFDTVRAEAGRVVHLDQHLDRLAKTCQETGIPGYDRAVLRSEVMAVCEALGGSGTIRMTLTGSARRLVLGWPPEPGRFHRPIRAARGRWSSIPALSGEAKHTSRMHWMIMVQKAGVDEVFLVDEADRFTEGTTCGIFASIGGELWTAPHDGRILMSTTALSYIQRAERLGIPVRREGPPADGPWDALYAASTTRKLAPVAELDGVELPMWCELGTRLVQEDGYVP